MFNVWYRWYAVVHALAWTAPLTLKWNERLWASKSFLRPRSMYRLCRCRCRWIICTLWLTARMEHTGSVEREKFDLPRLAGDEQQQHRRQDAPRCEDAAHPLLLPWNRGKGDKCVRCYRHIKQYAWLSSIAIISSVINAYSYQRGSVRRCTTFFFSDIDSTIQSISDCTQLRLECWLIRSLTQVSPDILNPLSPPS